MPPKKKVVQQSQIQETTTPSKKLTLRELVERDGASGTYIVNGFLESDYNADLAGIAGLQKYDQMRRSDAQIRATLDVMALPIRSTEWYIEAGKNEEGETDEACEEIRKFVEEALFQRMEQPWTEYLREVLTFFEFGFSVFERVYEVADDHVWIQKLGYRKQTTIYKWEQEDGTAGITQILPTPTTINGQLFSQVSIPAAKLLIFSFRKEGDNYAGISVLRSAYRHWYIKDVLYKFDSIRHERQSVGIPYIKLPKAATQEDKDLATQILKDLRANEQSGIVLPSAEWEFGFCDLQAGNTSDVWKSIEHHNAMIAKNVLAMFMELVSGEGGSRALSEDQSDFFLLSLEAVARQIDDVHNRYLIQELVDLNFDVPGASYYPKLAHKKLGTTDYGTLSTVLATLTGSGIITTDPELETWARKELDLPAKVVLQEGIDAYDTEDDGEEVYETDMSQEEIIDEEEEFSETPKKKELRVHSHKDATQQKYSEYVTLCDWKQIVRLQNSIPRDASDPEPRARGWKFNEIENESWRPLTFAEKKVNFNSLQDALSGANEKFDQVVDALTADQKADILTQVKRAVDANDIAAVGKIKAKYTGNLSSALTDIQNSMFETGKKSVAAEIGVKVPPTAREIAGALRVQNDKIVDKFVTDMETAASSAVTQIAAKKGGSITATGTTEAVQAAAAAMDKAVDQGKAAMRTLSVIGTLNLGRSTIFERYPEEVAMMQYSAIIDEVTTDICLSLDGLTVKPGSAEFYAYSPPRHYNCRSIWVEILRDEDFIPDETGIPKTIPANATIDTFQDLEAPFVQDKSPAMKMIKQEIEEREQKIADYKEQGIFANRIQAHQERIDALKSALDAAQGASISGSIGHGSETISKTADLFKIKEAQLKQIIQDAGNDNTAIDNALKQELGKKYDVVRERLEKAVDEGNAPIGSLDIADPLRQAIFGKRLPSPIDDDTIDTIVNKFGITKQDAKTVLNAVSSPGQLGIVNKFGNDIVVGNTDFIIPHVPLNTIKNATPTAISGITIDPTELRSAIEEMKDGKVYDTTGNLIDTVKEPVNIFYNTNTGEYTLQNGYHRLLGEMLQEGETKLPAEITFGNKQDGFYIDSKQNFIKPKND